MTTVILKEAISHLSLDGFFFFIFFHSIRLLLAIFFFVIIYLSLIMWTISFLEFWALLQKASFFSSIFPISIWIFGPVSFLCFALLQIERIITSSSLLCVAKRTPEPLSQS